MGMYTNVIVHPSHIPDRFHGLSGWQTKDVVEPDLETLEIREDGRLFYRHFDRDFVDDDSLVGFHLVEVREYYEDTNFHGIMEFYSGNIEDPNSDDWKLIEFYAKFTDGNLVSVSRAPQSF